MAKSMQGGMSAGRANPFRTCGRSGHILKTPPFPRPHSRQHRGPPRTRICSHRSGTSAGARLQPQGGGGKCVCYVWGGARGDRCG